MLCLTRKTNERVRIGRDIVVTVLEVRGDKVRLGIKAPAEVGVWRQEVVDRSPELVDELAAA
jgi:carbon storage regulator